MRVLAIDYGTKRIGLAVSDPDCGVALPLRVCEAESFNRQVDEVDRACLETGADLVLLGLPLNMDGTEGPAVHAVRRFMEALVARLNVPVKLWDERLTTVEADRVLLEADMSRAKRKRVRDKLAARLLLQAFLDSRLPADTQEQA